MGNMHCPAQDAAHLASVARGICPFPNYNPSPLFVKMLTMNASLELRNHYTAVQSSLTPKQLEDFTHGLRTTFGKEGKVTLGGMGVVALSLAVLFDSLARQARGDRVSDSGPIPGLFIKDLRGRYPPYAHTTSEYLRLVPHIANNPTRMFMESERYLKQIVIDLQSMGKSEGNHTLSMKEDTGAINVMLGQFFMGSLMSHLRHFNSTAEVTYPQELFSWLDPAYQGTVPADLIINLNCDPEVADKDFLAKVQQSENRTQNAFKSCMPGNGDKPKTWLLYVAQLEWLDVMFMPVLALGENDLDAITAQRGDFDLKAGALGKWNK